MNLYINLINRVITVFKTKIVKGSFDVARSTRSYLLNYFTFYHFYHLSVFFIIHAAIFLYCFLCKYFRVLVCLISIYNRLYLWKHIQEFFTLQLENDSRMVKMLFFNINFYSEIRFQKFVDSNFV